MTEDEIAKARADLERRLRKLAMLWEAERILGGVTSEEWQQRQTQEALETLDEEIKS